MQPRNTTVADPVLLVAGLLHSLGGLPIGVRAQIRHLVVVGPLEYHRAGVDPRDHGRADTADVARRRQIGVAAPGAGSALRIGLGERVAAQRRGGAGPRNGRKVELAVVVVPDGDLLRFAIRSEAPWNASAQADVFVRRAKRPVDRSDRALDQESLNVEGLGVQVGTVGGKAAALAGKAIKPTPRAAAEARSNAIRS